MADPLSEAENTCLQTLAELNKLRESPNGAEADMEKRLRDATSTIAKSRKKIMVRSPEGQKLSADILRDAAALQTAVSDQSRDMNTAEVNASLLKLENDVRKLEIYWKSFEYVTT